MLAKSSSVSCKVVAAIVDSRYLRNNRNNNNKININLQVLDSLFVTGTNDDSTHLSLREDVLYGNHSNGELFISV